MRSASTRSVGRPASSEYRRGARGGVAHRSAIGGGSGCAALTALGASSEADDAAGDGVSCCGDINGGSGVTITVTARFGFKTVCGTRLAAAVCPVAASTCASSSPTRRRSLAHSPMSASLSSSAAVRLARKLCTTASGQTVHGAHSCVRIEAQEWRLPLPLRSRAALTAASKGLGGCTLSRA